MNRKLVCTIVVLLSFVLECSRKLPEIFPGQASGWAKQGDTRTFTAENLYEYIDGEAEKYVQAGLKRALTADYKYQDKDDAVVDVFMMSNADGARKVFESQSEASSKPVALGDAARLYSGSLTFRKRAYYVRMIAYDANAGDRLIDLGRAIEGKLE